jgi:hypothetical protein
MDNKKIAFLREMHTEEYNPKSMLLLIYLPSSWIFISYGWVRVSRISVLRHTVLVCDRKSNRKSLECLKCTSSQ